MIPASVSALKEGTKNLSPLSDSAMITSYEDSSQFAAILIHEVRNPLTSINLSIEMLESVITDNDLKIYLGIIKRNSVKINNLITEIIKCQHTGIEVIEKHSMYQLLDDVLEMAGDLIRLKHIVVRKEYDAEDCSIKFSKPKMMIALTNIIANAIDAISLKKGLLTIATDTVDDRYVVQIIDNGCGINKVDLKDIFEPYVTNKPGGLGLGLATTYEILQSNNVEVNVESIEGEGTRFALFFRK
jgi:signal transduction histidine kinase